MSRLQKKYVEEVVPAIMKASKGLNIMQVPALKKIIISMGIAEAAKDKSFVQEHIEELMMLSGQCPITIKSKKAISNFKLREGQPVGLKVTLRRKRMYDFFDRFCNIVCPRIRDFRGFSTKGDGMGNYSIGLDDQQVFPEVNLDKAKRVQGMNITFVTSANTDAECAALLKLLGFPFKENLEKK